MNPSPLESLVALAKRCTPGPWHQSAVHHLRVYDEHAQEVASAYIDRDAGERVSLDMRYEGGWYDHDASYEHYMAVGGSRAAGPDATCVGPSEEAAYTYWCEILPTPAAPADTESE